METDVTLFLSTWNSTFLKTKMISYKKLLSSKCNRTCFRQKTKYNCCHPAISHILENMIEKSSVPTSSTIFLESISLLPQ